VVAVPMVAQDVAEAARQARKQKTDHAKHVYSNDDLARRHILTAEDRRQMEAKRRQQNVPAGQPPVELDAQSNLQELPLGDIARKFRAQKQILGQMPQSAEFHLPFGNTVLAAPRPAFVFAMPRPLPVQPRTVSVPRPPAFSNTAGPRTIMVRSGDTLWRLAEKNLGNGYRWHELIAANPRIVNPEHLPAGAAIRVTPETPATPEQTKFTVRKGDNLWKIAEAKLGFGAQWSCLAEANPSIVDANRIYAGQVLVLPAACAIRKKKK
jgi:nucleoid-associated protein YgaU